MAAAHTIVDALRSKRDVTPEGAKTVGPRNQDRTLFHLGMGHDHRGATWFDTVDGVVWLCAYGLHRSGAPDDAFPYFHSLTRSGQIWPAAEDYTWLEVDRAERLADALPEAAQNLLDVARGQPNIEHRAVIGPGEVGMVVEIVETLEETYVAVVVTTMGDPTRLVTLLGAFYPERAWSDWQDRDHLPTRALAAGELCFSILHAG